MPKRDLKPGNEEGVKVIPPQLSLISKGEEGKVGPLSVKQSSNISNASP